MAKFNWEQLENGYTKEDYLADYIKGILPRPPKSEMVSYEKLLSMFDEIKSSREKIINIKNISHKKDQIEFWNKLWSDTPCLKI